MICIIQSVGNIAAKIGQEIRKKVAGISSLKQEQRAANIAQKTLQRQPVTKQFSVEPILRVQQWSRYRNPALKLDTIMEDRAVKGGTIGSQRTPDTQWVGDRPLLLVCGEYVEYAQYDNVEGSDNNIQLEDFKDATNSVDAYVDQLFDEESSDDENGSWDIVQEWPSEPKAGFASAWRNDPLRMTVTNEQLTKYREEAQQQNYNSATHDDMR